MKSGSFVPGTSTDGNVIERDTASIGLSNASPAGERSARLGDHDPHPNGDLRSVVARRFMGMLRSHDRARMESLAAHPPQAK